MPVKKNTVDDKVVRSHFNALHVLLNPLIDAQHGFKDITWKDAARILREWDRVRSIDGKSE